MKIETKIEFKDYLDLNLQLIFSKISFYFIPLAIIIFFINHTEGIINKDIFSLMFFILILAVVIWPLFKIHSKIKSGFYTNKNLQEFIIYEFQKEKINIVGESFQSEISWSNIHKIKELKNWFLIYQSENVANLVPKKNFTKQQEEELRNLITSHNIKSKLRKD